MSLIGSSISALDVAKIKSQLERLLHDKDVPDEVAKVVAMLHDSIDVLRCTPMINQGNCYKSNPCELPKVKIDHQPIRIILTVCKKPYKMMIDWLPVKIPSWATVDLKPIVIDFNNGVSGSMSITSDTEMKLKVRHIHIGVAKARFMINAMLRYDCTKPTNDLVVRASENAKAPNGQYNLLYYSLKIRIELKKKKVGWLKFKYVCVKCEDLINKSGVIGYGPRSCLDEGRKYVGCAAQCRSRGIFCCLIPKCRQDVATQCMRR